jgi:hypothetical protein
MPPSTPVPAIRLPQARGNSTLVAAHYLGRSQITMRRWRQLGVGPAFRIVNGRAYYDLVDLDAFLDGNPRFTSTAERRAHDRRTVAQAAA